MAHQNINHLATRLSDSQQSMPQLGKDPVKIVISDSPTVIEEPAVDESLGSNLEELESVGVHEEQTLDLIVGIHVELATSVTNYSGNTVTPPNSCVSPEINPTRPNNIPFPSVSPDLNVEVLEEKTPDLNVDPGNTVTPPNSSVCPKLNRTTRSASPPQEDNKLGFTVFAVELLGALTNLVVSSRQKNNQVLIYVVVACSTLAFSIIFLQLLVLRKKRPTIAKKIQKAAFLMGTFGSNGNAFAFNYCLVLHCLCLPCLHVDVCRCKFD